MSPPCVWEEAAHSPEHWKSWWGCSTPFTTVPMWDLSLWNVVQNKELFSLIRRINVWNKYIIIFLLSRFARPKSNFFIKLINIFIFYYNTLLAVGRLKAELSNHRAEHKYAVLWLAGCPHIVHQAGSELNNMFGHVPKTLKKSPWRPLFVVIMYVVSILFFCLLIRVQV